MREMKDSGMPWVGEIPKEWQTLKSKFIFKQRNTRGNNICIRLLSPTQKYGVIPQDNYEELTGMNAVKLNDNTNYALLKTIHKGDYCISLRSFQGGFEYSEYEGVVSPAYQVFYPIITIADGYYKFLFKERGFIDVMNSYTMGLRDGKNIAFDDFGDTFIPVPPLAEQQKIAEFLDGECGKIDGLKADIQAQIDTLEQYKRSIITEAVIHGLNPSVPMKDSGINYISKYPITWSLRRLKYILIERNERSVTGTEELLSVSLYKGVIPSTEMANRTMQADNLIGYKRVHKGDLVFNKLNPGMARFGCSNYDGITSPDFAVYIVNENYCNAKFLQYLLKTDFYVAKIKSVSMGVGDGFSRLYSNQLYEFFVALPPRDEVSIIINYLDNKCAEIEKIIADKKAQIEILDGYKKSLIYEYVTGKKEPK